jgi:hypothetical protein
LDGVCVDGSRGRIPRIEILTQASDGFTTLPGFSWQCGPGAACFECASIFRLFNTKRASQMFVKLISRAQPSAAKNPTTNQGSSGLIQAHPTGQLTIGASEDKSKDHDSIGIK